MVLPAVFSHGEYRAVDYTAEATITAGDMVLLGNSAGITLGVAHHDIANTVGGSLAVGGGVYHCQVASNYAAWTKVYKPAANSILTTTSTNNAQFGFTVQTSAAANAVVRVLHHPYV